MPVGGGGLVGGIAGTMLDERDRPLTAEAAHRALETAPAGTAVAWQNPNTGSSGVVTPTRNSQRTSVTCCESTATA